MLEQEAKRIIGNEDTTALKNMVKALSSPIAAFMNTDEDYKRLEAAKIVLRLRKRQAAGR